MFILIHYISCINSSICFLSLSYDLFNLFLCFSHHSFFLHSRPQKVWFTLSTCVHIFQYFQCLSPVVFLVVYTVHTRCIHGVHTVYLNALFGPLRWYSQNSQDLKIRGQFEGILGLGRCRTKIWAIWRPCMAYSPMGSYGNGFFMVAPFLICEQSLIGDATECRPWPILRRIIWSTRTDFGFLISILIEFSTHRIAQLQVWASASNLIQLLSIQRVVQLQVPYQHPQWSLNDNKDALHSMGTSLGRWKDVCSCVPHYACQFSLLELSHAIPMLSPLNGRDVSRCEQMWAGLIAVTMLRRWFQASWNWQAGCDISGLLLKTL